MHLSSRCSLNHPAATSANSSGRLGQTSLPVSAGAAARWLPVLAVWRALAACGQLTAAGRAQQRRGLTRLLAALGGALARRPAALVGPQGEGTEGQRLLLAALETATAAVAQKHVSCD